MDGIEMSLHVFQWLREFCASHSHFWAENKPIFCVWMEVCTQGKRRAGSILTQCQHWCSRSPRLILLLSRDGKSKSGSQSNYCLGCLLCSQPSSSEHTKETEQIKAGTTSIFPPSQLEVLISHWRKGSLKEFPKAEPLKAQPLGVMCELQEWQHRAWVGISPLSAFVLLFFQLQPWQREGLTGSFLRENLEMEGNSR